MMLSVYYSTVYRTVVWTRSNSQYFLVHNPQCCKQTVASGGFNPVNFRVKCHAQTASDTDLHTSCMILTYICTSHVLQPGSTFVRFRNLEKCRRGLWWLQWRRLHGRSRICEYGSGAFSIY